MSRKGIKKYLQFKPEVTRIFDELESYKRFCVEFGFVYNEAHLGNDHSPYNDFRKWHSGRYPRDNWGYMIKQGKKNFA